MKNILLHIHDDPAMQSRLQVALDLARAFGGHLSCVQATPIAAYVAADPFGGMFVMGDVLEKVEQREQELRSALEQQLQRDDVPWSWDRFDGDPAGIMVDRSRLADLVVMSRTAREPRPREPLALIEDVALHTRVPLLAVPADASSLDPARPVLVAWNGAPEAAGALRAALPLLARAASVNLLVVGDEHVEFGSGEAAQYLSRHGIEAEVHLRASGGHDVADVIQQTARELACGLIVMGAYGHSRLREYLLGGVTRRMLATAGLPLLLSH